MKRNCTWSFISASKQEILFKFSFLRFSLAENSSVCVRATNGGATNRSMKCMAGNSSAFEIELKATTAEVIYNSGNTTLSMSPAALQALRFHMVYSQRRVDMEQPQESSSAGHKGLIIALVLAIAIMVALAVALALLWRQKRTIKARVRVLEVRQAYSLDHASEKPAGEEIGFMTPQAC